MVATIPTNPYAQTNAAGTFNTSSNGYVQGTAMDDPATRYRLRGGYLSTAETIPMWGGVGIYEDVPGTAGQPQAVVGPKVGRATSISSTIPLLGFTVFDQNYSGVQSPQSPVPLVPSLGTVNYYPLGSLARIAVQCDPALTTLQGGLTNAQVSWDFINQLLVPYTAAYSAVTITGAVWASTAGGRTTFTVGTDLTTVLAAGSNIDVSGVVSTGGTGLGFNGHFIVVSVTSTTIVVTQAAASSPGTYSSGGTVAAGGGALACKILRVSADGNMTVSYDSSTGLATWNRNGACALIQI
jgi:hypothetical protein